MPFRRVLNTQKDQNFSPVARWKSRIGPAWRLPVLVGLYARVMPAIDPVAADLRTLHLCSEH
jgi:hypothetical protein